MNAMHAKEGELLTLARQIATQFECSPELIRKATAHFQRQLSMAPACQC